jgi:hypothetical protein
MRAPNPDNIYERLKVATKWRPGKEEALQEEEEKGSFLRKEKEGTFVGSRHSKEKEHVFIYHVKIVVLMMANYKTLI